MVGVDVIFGIIASVALALAGWTLKKTIDHETRLAVAEANIKYMDARYDAIMAKLDKMDDRLVKYGENTTRFFEEYELTRRQSGARPRTRKGEQDE